ncbi:MAG: flagellar export chaperone FliS [Comamonadaceae bacterium]|nr:MAG: flagellar export chaperone FliS [Comamonadaceae bacterium]
MYTPLSMRASAAYQTVAVHSSIDGASAHRLVELVFDGLQQSLRGARGALERGDVALKGTQIGRAVRFLEEGLKGGLNDAQGGELAASLRALYDYCIQRLTAANLHNDVSALAEVEALIAPVALGWREIGQHPAALAR